MAEYTSDEERFSALINFFKDNKNTLLIGLVGALIIAISFFAYNSYDANQNAEASKLYDDWFSSLNTELSNEDDQFESFNNLQNQYSNTGHAMLARMVRASSYARKGDLEKALADYRILLDDTSGIFGNEMLNSIAKLNIARIELSKSNYSKALEVLESFDTNSEHTLIYEVKGDALVGLKKNELAIDQYTYALENARNDSQRSLIKMKINNIANSSQ
ncbi:MAG: hypothetical protein CMD68_04115 [Gammaproteobacteria bacterium]|nr:hypothetical protein [Gammaproteobacteria bacterium]